MDIGHAHSVDRAPVVGFDGQKLTPLPVEAALRVSAYLQAAQEQGVTVSVRPCPQAPGPCSYDAVVASYDPDSRSLDVPGLAVDGSGAGRTGDVAQAQYETLRAVALAVDSGRCAADLEVVAPGLGDDVLADLRIEGAEAFATRHIGDLYSYDVLPEINEAVESRTGTPLPQPVYSDWGPQVLEKYGQDALEYLETDVADGMDLRVEDRLAPAVAQALRAYRADPALAGQEPYTWDAHRGVQVDSAVPPERRIVSARTLDAATSPDAGTVDR